MFAPRRHIALLMLITGLAPAAQAAQAAKTVAANAASTPAAASPSQPQQAASTPFWPSFMVPNDVLCLDEFDYNAYSETGRFHSRGSRESCTRVTQLTRVIVLNQGANPKQAGGTQATGTPATGTQAAGTRSEIMVVSGPLEWTVGWTNGRLPIAK